jgi:hypothetical protein
LNRYQKKSDEFPVDFPNGSLNMNTLHHSASRETRLKTYYFMLFPIKKIGFQAIVKPAVLAQNGDPPLSSDFRSHHPAWSRSNHQEWGWINMINM